MMCMLTQWNTCSDVIISLRMKITWLIVLPVWNMRAILYPLRNLWLIILQMDQFCKVLYSPLYHVIGKMASLSKILLRWFQDEVTFNSIGIARTYQWLLSNNCCAHCGTMTLITQNYSRGSRDKSLSVFCLVFITQNTILRYFIDLTSCNHTQKENKIL